MDKKKLLKFSALVFLSVLVILSFYLGLFKFSGFFIYNSQPNSTNGVDTYIKELSTTNYGTSSVLEVGKNSNPREFRSLLKFNISSIPSTDTILWATLRVYVNSSSGIGNRTINVYGITKSWEELGATWDNNSVSSLWSSPGGDFSGEVTFKNIGDASGEYYNFTVSSLVREWFKGTSPNYGFLLLSNDSSAGNYTSFGSSNSLNSSQRPKLIIDYVSNAPPTIINLTTNTNPSSPIEMGSSVNFRANWTDLEGDSSQLFICNSSNISKSGCSSYTFCNTSISQTNPAECSYTSKITDNRTNSFWAGMCDFGNCTTSNESFFYINHPPSAYLLQPNGGETLNESQGDYPIKFNSSDEDSDELTANLYYGQTQNSTTNLIKKDLNLSNYCSPSISSVAKNCTYLWNTTGIYGDYYLTLILNDSYSLGKDSSSNLFFIRSLEDNIPPKISSVSANLSAVYPGTSVRVNASVQDQNLKSVWIDFNYTTENLTMTNINGTFHTADFYAPAPGNYSFVVYAQDIVGNLNKSAPLNFSVLTPFATESSLDFPKLSLVDSVIKISSQLNATNPLRGVGAYLNVPEGFVFTPGSPQQFSLGNFSKGEIKTATWFLSVPLNESIYLLNITYRDNYSDLWNGKIFNMTVTKTLGGYSSSMSGYPLVSSQTNYFVRAYFKKNGLLVNPDSTKIELYDSLGNLIVGPALMQEEGSGIYNYTYLVGTSVNEGQWEAVVNMTKNSVSYYSYQFFKVVGGPFDVRNITIENSSVNKLNISVTAQNTGGVNKDLYLKWNLTRLDTGKVLDSGGDTFMVSANSKRFWTIAPVTNYVGQVKIVFLGYYSGTERAGAYKIFSTTSAIVGGSSKSPGGSSGLSGETIKQSPSLNKTNESKIIYNLTVESFDSEVYLEKGVKKTTYLWINNTGNEILKAISLSINGLNKSYYNITPAYINSLNPGKIMRIKVEFFSSKTFGKTSAVYIFNSKEKNVTKEFNITSLGGLDWMKERQKELVGNLNSIKEKAYEKGLGDSFSTCEKLLNGVNVLIKKGKFIEAGNLEEKVEQCTTTLNSNLFKNETKNWMRVLIFLSLFFIVLLFIVLFSFLIRKLRKRKEVEVFLKKKERTQEPKTIDEKTFKDELDRIKDKIKE